MRARRVSQCFGFNSKMVLTMKESLIMSVFQDHQWVGNNRFSSLFNLGGAMGVWSGGKEDLMEEASVYEE